MNESPDEIVGGGVPPVTSAPSNREPGGIAAPPVMLTVPVRLAVVTVGAVKFWVVVPLTTTIPRFIVVRLDVENVAADVSDWDRLAVKVPFGSCAA
jgi:hypothetical protein